MARVGVKCRVIDLSWGDETVEYDLEVEAARAEYAAIPDDLVVSAEIDQDLDNQDTYAAVVEAVKDHLYVEYNLNVPSAQIEVEGLGRRGPRGDSVKGDKGDPGGKGDKGYKWRGKAGWNKNETYTVDDVVTFEKATYICVKDVNPALQFHDEDPDVNDARTDATHRYWDQISDRPPKWRKQWEAGKTYRPGDLVWVNTVAPNNKDKKTVYICVTRHDSAEGNKPSADSVLVSGSVWEIFTDENPGSDGEGQTWKGEWSAYAAYNVNDVVVHEDEMYVCVKAVAAVVAPNTNAEPDDTTNLDGKGASTEWWNLLIKRTPKPFSPAAWKTAKNQLSGTTRKFRVGHLVKHANTQWICLRRHRVSQSPEPGKDPTTWQNYLLTEEDGGIPTLRGEWSSLSGTTAFEVFDLVTHESATFKCRTAHTKRSTEPDDDTTYWEVYSERPVSIRGAWSSGVKYKKGNVVTHNATIGGLSQTYNFILNQKLNSNEHGIQPQNLLTRWKVMDGPLGPTGRTGPTGIGTEGKRGKPGAGFFSICDGNKSNQPIPTANRTSIIDGVWPHNMKSTDVPAGMVVRARLGVKMAKGNCTFRAYFCNASGQPPVTGATYIQLAATNKDEGGFTWDYAPAFSASGQLISASVLDAWPYISLWKVSGTESGQAEIAKAKFAIWFE